MAVSYSPTMGGGIMEYLAAVILIIVFATGYIKTIKK
jgi:hypothetical protein